MEVGFQDDEIEEVLPNFLALFLLQISQACGDQRQPVAGGPATRFQVLQISKSKRIGDGLEANLFGEMVEVPSAMFFAVQLRLRTPTRGRSPKYRRKSAPRAAARG